MVEPKVTVIPLQWKQMKDGAGVMRNVKVIQIEKDAQNG